MVIALLITKNNMALTETSATLKIPLIAFIKQESSQRKNIYKRNFEQASTLLNNETCYIPSTPFGCPVEDIADNLINYVGRFMSLDFKTT